MTRTARTLPTTAVSSIEPFHTKLLFRSETQLSYGRLSSAETAHPVNSCTRRGRAGAEKDILDRCFIGDRRQNQLFQALLPPGDVAPDTIGIIPLHIRRRHNMPGNYSTPETGGEALNLVFDASGHIRSGSVGNMTVTPDDMPATVARTGMVEKARLN